ncbi:hypothetical protein OG455_18230 [Kitasatospora sp. NBC_01287]|nr:hypothetical protein [Kitasatospora sp. NBC_01287]MCX4747435.1 hypothetical protein [Kitasatospora sp. NBC_01287]
MSGSGLLAQLTSFLTARGSRLLELPLPALIVPDVAVVGRG